MLKHDEAMEALIVKFWELCSLEKFTKEEIADKGYLSDKIDIWLDNEFITEKEADYLNDFLMNI